MFTFIFAEMLQLKLLVSVILVIMCKYCYFRHFVSTCAELRYSVVTTGLSDLKVL